MVASRAAPAPDAGLARSVTPPDPLADNPYRNETEEELRKGYGEDGRGIGIRKRSLARSRAYPDRADDEAFVAAATERRKQRRAVVDANGWEDIRQPRRMQSNTRENEGR